MPDAISKILLHQRMREGIMAYLEWVASYQNQREYQVAVPLVNVPVEAINQWEDWVSGGRIDALLEPVFSPDEQIAVRDYHRVWSNVADETPDQLPTLDELIGTGHWERLRSAAEKTHEVFMRRGHFDGDVEQFPLN